MRNFLFFLLLSAFACQNNSEKTPAPAPAAKQTFYIGTYTQHEGHVDGKGNGIYKMTFEPSSLTLQVTDTIKGMTNPSFVALPADQSLLYAVNEISPGGSAMGQLEAYGLGAGNFGKKIFAGSTGSHAPCHIAQDKDGRMAAVCNYVGGVVAVFPLPLKENAAPQMIKLPNVPKTNPRQDGSHPHSTAFSPDGRFAYVADLGTDRIMQYQVDAAQQKLMPAAVPFFTLTDGAGPRHMTFAADGKILYVLCELSNQVAVMAVQPDGTLKQTQTINTLPVGFQSPNTSADLHLSKDGKRLYSSNRGHDSIAAFAVQADGTLAVLGHVGTEGKVPRNFLLTADGNWMLVANQNTDNIALFDLKKGDIPVFVKDIKVNTPVSIVEVQ